MCKQCPMNTKAKTMSVLEIRNEISDKQAQGQKPCSAMVKELRKRDYRNIGNVIHTRNLV